MSERELERILEEEKDEGKVAEALALFLTTERRNGNG